MGFLLKPAVRHMKFFCSNCNVLLADSLEEVNSPIEWPEFEPGQDIHLVGKGFFRISDGDEWLGQEGDYILNRSNLENIVENKNWHMGCCGSDGSEGINISCTNGHDIATEISECYLTKYIILAKEAVRNA